MEKIEQGGELLFIGETVIMPFKRAMRDVKIKSTPKEYHLVVIKAKRRDGQINAFTGEDFTYSAIITNNLKKTQREIVRFYNQRGTIEREFDVLKNDFGWSHLAFSKLEENTVYLLLTAMCRNIYDYIINLFSDKFDGLSNKFRFKKFLFRFVCIPTKWIKTGRELKLRIYGKIQIQT